MTTPRVAVIGGGAAGLIAASHLRALGAEPTLLEAAASVGGVIRTIRRDGWIAEAGAHTIAEPDAAVRGLLDAAGIASQTVHSDPAHTRRLLVYHGGVVAVPRSVGELVSWPVLSAAGRMRLLKEPFIKPSSADAEESVDAFVRRRLGEEMAERVFDALIAGGSAGDPTHLLVRYLLPRLVEWEQDGGSLLKGAMRAGVAARRRAGRASAPTPGIWSCLNGLGEVPEHLATMLGQRVRTGVRVVAIAPGHGGFDVVDACGQRDRFDAVVSAVPARTLGTIACDVSDAAVLREVAVMPQATVATVSLGFRRADVAHPLDGTGVLAPSCEKRQILGTVFASSLFPGRTPKGHVLLTSSVGGIRQAELAALPEAALVALVREELGSLLGVQGEPQFVAVTVWPDCQPQAVAGHTARLAGVAALEESCPGLAFVGAWRDGLALGEVMRGSIAAIDALVVRMKWSLGGRSQT